MHSTFVAFAARDAIRKLACGMAYRADGSSSKARSCGGHVAWRPARIGASAMRTLGSTCAKSLARFMLRNISAPPDCRTV